MKRNTSLFEKMKRLAEQENQFLQSEFLAPVAAGGVVRVRIAGVMCTLAVAPDDFEGWGVFSPLSHREAVLVREASLMQRRSYLDLFPRLQMILTQKAVGRDAQTQAGQWLATLAHQGDRRIHVQGLVPIALCQDVQLFDSISVRFDGVRFWYDELVLRGDLAAPAALREHLLERTPPKELDRPGLTAAQRAAYEWNYLGLTQPNRTRDRPGRRSEFRVETQERNELHFADMHQQRLYESLSHAGAELVDYMERNDSYRVTFNVDGARYTSSVAKSDLSLHVAGICLSGEDHKFDLGSLVGVLREGSDDGSLLAIGDENEGMSEEEYWRIHPRRNQPRRR